VVLSKLTFISLLTEGINTVVPLFEDEIFTCYEVVQDYLKENFSTLETHLNEKDESGFPTITISNESTGENAFTLSFENEKIYVLKDGDLLDYEVAGSMYGILTILCTFLIARLNSFSFKSKEIDPFNTEVRVDDTGFSDYPSDSGKIDDSSEDNEDYVEEDSESDFDDEYI
jgi:hypothetical protein